MAKGFYLHNAIRNWILNNPFLKSEKSLHKIVFEIYFPNITLAKKAL
jgi:hypothetical protein